MSDRRSDRKARPGTCAICRHPACMEIEVARIRGASIGALAKQHSVSTDSIWRHMKNHVTAKRRAELAGGVAADNLVAVAERESRTLVQYLSIIRGGLLDLFQVARGAGDASGASMLSGRLRENLKILANLSGELRQAGGVVINNNSLTVTLDPRLYQGLLRFAESGLSPEKSAELVALLRSFDDPAPAGPMIECSPAEDEPVEDEIVDAELESMESAIAE